MHRFYLAACVLFVLLLAADTSHAEHLPFNHGIQEGSAVGSDGKSTTDIDLNGNKIFDSTRSTQYDIACTDAHAMGTGSGCFGGQVQITGISFLDGSARFGSDARLGDSLPLRIGTGLDHSLIYDQGIGALELTSTDTDGGGTDGVTVRIPDGQADIALGANLDFLTNTANGVANPVLASFGVVRETFAFSDMVDGGGTVGTIALTQTIPDGAVTTQTLIHTLTGFTNDTSAVVTVGDGSVVDRYNTGTPDVFVTNASGVAMGVPSGAVWHDAAATVTVTITTATDFTLVDAGTLTIAIFYYGP